MINVYFQDVMKKKSKNFHKTPSTVKNYYIINFSILIPCLDIITHNII